MRKIQWIFDEEIKRLCIVSPLDLQCDVVEWCLPNKENSKVKGEKYCCKFDLYFTKFRSEHSKSSNDSFRGSVMCLKSSLASSSTKVGRGDNLFYDMVKKLTKY